MSVEVMVTPELASQGWLTRWIQNALDIALMRTLRQIGDVIKDFVPVRSGNLKNSLEVSIVNEGIRLTWSAPYAEYVDKGASPHIIEPTGQALKFEAGGQTVFAKRVSHPGFAGLDFSSLAMFTLQNMLQEEFIKAANETKVQ
jgi:hypothetical protein